MNQFNRLSSIVTAFTIWSWSAHASAPQNLPNFGEQVSVGRMQAFVSPKGLTWFLPLAMRSELSCSPGSTSRAARRSCNLRVFNNFSPNEEAALVQLERSTGTKVVALSAMDSGKVLTVGERFPTFAQGIETGEMILRTLQVNPSGPYASVLLRAQGKTISEIEEQYKSQGLGEFKSEVTMRGESVDAYLAINNAQLLRQELSQLTGRYSNLQMTQIIDRLISRLSVTAYGFQEDEKRNVLQHELRRFFQNSRHRQYEVSQTKVQHLTDTHVILDDRSAPFVAICTATLDLREGGVSQTRCEEVAQ